MADLEARLGALENEEHQRVTDVLQDMLIKERERNSQLERKVASLLQKVRELKQGAAEPAPRPNTAVKHQPRLDEGQRPLSAKARGIWRILGGGDD
jgi:BMFP domain-containing protein YqiC